MSDVTNTILALVILASFLFVILMGIGILQTFYSVNKSTSTVFTTPLSEFINNVLLTPQPAFSSTEAPTKLVERQVAISGLMGLLRNDLTSWRMVIAYVGLSESQRQRTESDDPGPCRTSYNSDQQGSTNPYNNGQPSDRPVFAHKVREG